MDLVLYGLNHTTAPIEIRERLSFKLDDASRMMTGLRSKGIFSESLLLSTCNRTEVYGIADQAEESIRRLQETLTEGRDMKPGLLQDHGYMYLNAKAVQHLFRVSAGLDSLIIGEVEILGQIKDAYRAATGVDATGPYLNRLFHHCFRVGKRVRNETAISTGGISVGSSAVELARKVLGNLSGKKALLIGAGETGQLVAKHLHQAGIGEFTVTNRTQSRAEELARELDGLIMPFEEYPRELSKFDLVITAIGAPERTVRREMLRRTRSLYPLLIDLGVPRDVDPEVDRMSGSIVYRLDDLEVIVTEKLAKREKEIPKVERIVAEESARFISWSDSLRALRTVEDLRVQLHMIKEVTLEKWRRRLSPKELKAAERITNELINKVLHQPTISLKGCELKEGEKECESCEFFVEGRGCIHGHYSQELKCAITRLLFDLDNLSPTMITEGIEEQSDDWDTTDNSKRGKDD
jgi:glutamyl-tRNA reductase